MVTQSGTKKTQSDTEKTLFFSLFANLCEFSALSVYQNLSFREKR
jgi:hypothetical protein